MYVFQSGGVMACLPGRTQYPSRVATSRFGSGILSAVMPSTPWSLSAGLAALNGDYLAPYGTAFGQLVLAVIAALMVGCLLWMRRLTAAAPAVRFLVDPTTRGGAARDPEEVPAR